MKLAAAGVWRPIPDYVSGPINLVTCHGACGAAKADIAGGNGSCLGLEINNNSGHSRSLSESIQSGADAFRSFGIGF